MKRAASRSISPPALIPSERLAKYGLPIEHATYPSDRVVSTSVVEGKRARLDSLHDGHVRRCKIMTWNCDGLSQYLSVIPSGMDTFLKKAVVKTEQSVMSRFISKHESDVLCLQEVHLWSDEMKQVKKQLHIDAREYDVHAVLPIGRKGRRRAGVLTLFRKDLQVRDMSTVDWDHEGRVSIIRIGDLHVYNVYGLNSSENPFRDPVTEKVSGTRSERKRLFDSTLGKDLARVVTDGDAFILVGDLNISRARIDALGGHLRTHHPHDLNRKHFNQVFGIYRDIIRETYPEVEKYTWFSRAADSWTGNGDKARVDHIITSHGVNVIEADTLESSEDRAKSDHGPLFAILPLGNILNG